MDYLYLYNILSYPRWYANYVDSLGNPVSHDEILRMRECADICWQKYIGQ
jgi:hypothetical protein